MEAKDYFGHPIHVGDIVVYPTRIASNMHMNHGKVLEIITQADQWDKHKLIAKLKVHKLGTTGYGSRMKDVDAKIPSTIERLHRVVNLSYKEHGGEG